jgi:hypothetical protein
MGTIAASAHPQLLHHTQSGACITHCLPLSRIERRHLGFLITAVFAVACINLNVAAATAISTAA